jgi:multimeric flavodoxin WrbA
VREIVKTLLGLIGSPRKMGNSELLVKEIFRQLPDGRQPKLLRLPEFDIRPCTGCYQCLFGEMKCVLKDDFETVLRAIVDADAYVVGSPTYLLGANASLKRFLDRGLSFYSHMDKLWGKPAVGFVVAGYPGMEGYSKLMVDSFMAFTMADNRGSEVVYAALPGDVFAQGTGKEAAKRLAEALVAEKSDTRSVSTNPTCTQCGGDTFRFLDAGRLKCMLCSSEGTYAWEEGRVKTNIPRPDHPLFLSYEDVKNHLAWLQGMKEEFVARRKELKSLVTDYTEAGVWIRPDKGGE